MLGVGGRRGAACHARDPLRLRRRLAVGGTLHYITLHYITLHYCIVEIHVAIVIGNFAFVPPHQFASCLGLSNVALAWGNANRVVSNRVVSKLLVTITITISYYNLHTNSYYHDYHYYYLGGTQIGSYQTGSYRKGRFIPPTPNILYFVCFDTTPFICLNSNDNNTNTTTTNNNNNYNYNYKT